MSTTGRAMSLPTIQVLTPQRLRKSTSLQREIFELLNKVHNLRNDTDSIVCNCNKPDCPFTDNHQSPIHPANSITSLTDISPKLRRKEIAKSLQPIVLKDSPTLKGIERRSDGTIVERDGPRKISAEDTLEKRLMRSSLLSGGFQGQHLSVSNTVESISEADCLVDSDNLFGTSSDDDSTFSRFEPTRRHVRVTPQNARRATMIPASTSFPTSKPQVHRMSLTSTTKHQQYPLYLRGAASLPSCASLTHYYEDDEESLSTFSSSSSLGHTSQVSCPSSHNRQHGGLVTTP